MGRRARRRGQEPELEAPTSRYEGPDGAVLELRGVLSPKTRTQYAAVRAGRGGAQTQEDAWQRAVEFLFERLAVGWESAGVRYAGQKELLARLRAATPDERRWVRDVLREHVEEWFPEVQAP
jgi:hypothetical protein